MPQSLVHREPVEGGGTDVAGGADVRGLGADVVTGAADVEAVVEGTKLELENGAGAEEVGIAGVGADEL